MRTKPRKRKGIRVTHAEQLAHRALTLFFTQKISKFSQVRLRNLQKDFGFYFSGKLIPFDIAEAISNKFITETKENINATNKS
jgi:hypothetical protein